jgi:hypothetical protein
MRYWTKDEPWDLVTLFDEVRNTLSTANLVTNDFIEEQFSMCPVKLDHNWPGGLIWRGDDSMKFAIENNIPVPAKRTGPGRDTIIGDIRAALLQLEIGQSFFVPFSEIDANERAAEQRLRGAISHAFREMDTAKPGAVFVSRKYAEQKGIRLFRLPDAATAPVGEMKLTSNQQPVTKL